MGRAALHASFVAFVIHAERRDGLPKLHSDAGDLKCEQVRLDAICLVLQRPWIYHVARYHLSGGSASKSLPRGHWRAHGAMRESALECSSTMPSCPRSAAIGGRLHALRIACKAAGTEGEASRRAGEQAVAVQVQSWRLCLAVQGTFVPHGPRVQRNLRNRCSDACLLSVYPS